MNRRNFVGKVAAGAAVATVSGALLTGTAQGSQSNVTELHLMDGPHKGSKWKWRGAHKDTINVPTFDDIRGKHGVARYVGHKTPHGFYIGIFDGVHEA